MSIFVQNQHGHSLELCPEVIGEGAEGRIYRVLAPLPYHEKVVKLYKDIPKAQALADKIRYLILHQPRLREPDSVIFPEQLIYQNGQFAGFLMALAPGEADLNALCHLKLPTRLGPEWQSRYDRHTRAGMQNRMKVCYNLAATVNEIHRSRRFTFVDIKPENVRLRLDGKISMVDIDSIAISDGYELLFPAEKFTQEYSPAEFKELNLREDLISETWDRFSLSVILYKILFGIHPYAGTTRGQYSHLNTNEQKIAEGLFPQGEKKAHFETIPEPHQRFKELPRDLRQLFMNTFEHGHYLPARRASAQDWCKALSKKQARPYLLRRRASKKNTSPKPVSYRPASSTSHATKGLLPALLIFAGLVFAAIAAVNNKYERQMEEMYRKYGHQKVKAELTAFQEKMHLVNNPNFDAVWDFEAEKVTWVMKNKKMGLVDKNGQALTEIKYDWANHFRSGLALVRQDGKYGFINVKGEEVIPLIYENAFDFQGYVAMVKKNGKTLYINREGKVLPNVYHVGEYRENRATFKRKGLWGYLDENGTEVVLPSYDYAYPFHENRAVVNYFGKYGYIDQNGTMRLAPQFDYAESFSGGKARVRIGNDTFWIDWDGQRTSPPEGF
ncbi:MAG: hypothetical protein HC913_10170 [Microscillaceae bacterium]|nr:hypothetical protein [Microscillaceae bacterium]